MTATTMDSEWSSQPFNTHALDCNLACDGADMSGIEFSVGITLYNKDNGDESTIAFCFYDEDDNYNEYQLSCGRLGLCELKTIAESHMENLTDITNLSQHGYVLIF